MTRSTGPVAGLLAGATALAVLLPPAAATARPPPRPRRPAPGWPASWSTATTSPPRSAARPTSTTGRPRTWRSACSPPATAAGDPRGRARRSSPIPRRSTATSGSGDEAYAGAIAKLGLTTTLAGLDPHAVGGTDLVATLEGLEADTGRYRDQSAYGDFSNVLGQSFGLLFLDAAPGVDPSDAAVAVPRRRPVRRRGLPAGPRHADLRVEHRRHRPGAAGAGRRRRGPAGARGRGRRGCRRERDADGAWGDPANVNSTAYAGDGAAGAGPQRRPRPARSSTDTQNDDGGLPISPGGDSDPHRHRPGAAAAGRHHAARHAADHGRSDGRRGPPADRHRGQPGGLRRRRRRDRRADP